jgi:hypothetical protein
VSAGPIVLGVVLLVVAFVLLRYPDAVAEATVKARIDELRHSSLLNAEYVDREIEALRRPGSYRLSCWAARGGGVLCLVLAVVALVRGLG